MLTSLVARGYTLTNGTIVLPDGRELDAVELNIVELGSQNRVTIQFNAEAWPRILAYLNDPEAAVAAQREAREQAEAQQKEEAELAAARAKIVVPGGPVLGAPGGAAGRRGPLGGG
jgi:septal ring factor EnvC (AmiA/AmiB activator)